MKRERDDEDSDEEVQEETPITQESEPSPAPVKMEGEEEEGTAEAGTSKRKRKRKRKKKAAAASGGGDNTSSTGGDLTVEQKIESLDHTVFVEGIPFDCSEDEVKGFFSENGCPDVIQMRLPRYVFKKENFSQTFLSLFLIQLMTCFQMARFRTVARIWPRCF